MSETKTKNLCTVPAADLTDSQYFIAEDGGELKRIPKAQVVLKKLENMLATDTENLAGGGEVTAQELLDALAEQVANKLLAKSQVVNNLLATVEGNPLDATQGKALKDLIDTTNNNLSNYDKNNVDSPTIADCNSPRVKEGTLDENSKNTPNTEGLTTATEGHLSTIFPNRAGSWNAQMALYNGKNPCVFLRGADTEWAKWLALATKSDLTDIIIEKGFQKSVNIPAGNAYATIECDIEYTVPYGYRALAIYKGLVTNSTCCVYNTYFTGGKARLVISNLNGSQKTVTAYAFILFIKS